MKRSTIESLIKLPLQIPDETSVRLKNEPDTNDSISKPAHKKETDEGIHEINDGLRQVEPVTYSKGYIKYPLYDYF